MNTIKYVILVLLSCFSCLSVIGQVKVTPKIAKDSGITRVDSLKAAVVTAVARPRIKGDTVEYNTERIRMEPNSMVEEMLRRLPGLRVDGDGTITYNGQKIEHLLVDGEDIFGSAPALITRNFDASKIARIQIIDRKSEDSRFTGIADGGRIKTLNLVLKESEKNGFFGKVEGGADISKYYSANGVLAEFKGKEQFTVLSFAGNTGLTQFSDAGAAGKSILFSSNADALGASAGIGIPQFSALALHYANSWPNMDQHFVVNYRIDQYHSEPNSETEVVQLQRDSVYGQRQNCQSVNQQFSQGVNGIFDWQLNRRSAIEVSFFGIDGNSVNQFASSGYSTYNDTLVNSIKRTLNDKASTENYGFASRWKTTIGKKASRMISLTADVENRHATTSGYLYSKSLFYEANGNIETEDTIDQRKVISSHALTTKWGINFVEPLWSKTQMGFNYNFSVLTDKPSQATYDRGDGKYQDTVDSLDSYFRQQTILHHMTFNWGGVVGKISYLFGGDWTEYQYRQNDIIAGSALDMRYSYVTPSAYFNYAIGPNAGFDLEYLVTTQEPLPIQITPITNDSDPLNITKGNPVLRPSTNRELQFRFSRFADWVINASGTVTMIENSISTKVAIDSLGRQISEPVNVNGGESAGFSFDLARKAFGVDIAFNGTGGYSRSVNYINWDLAKTDVFNGGGGFQVAKYMVGKFAAQISGSAGYFKSVSSVNVSTSIHYWSEKYRVSLMAYAVPHFEINSTIDYTSQQKTNLFSSNSSSLLWNSYIGWNLCHNKILIKFQLNNALNQNVGITRNNFNNVSTQTSTNILGRYWMLSAAYHFDKKFKNK